MIRTRVLAVAALLANLACPFVPAQTSAPAQHDMPMKHEAGVPSASLTLTGLDGTSKTVSAAEFLRMPHVTVTVTNGHSHQQEAYGGVAVQDLLALVGPSKLVPLTGSAETSVKPKISPRMTIIIAKGTDGFRVALTLCDTDPGCRSGQVIVADTLNGSPLTTDGAFKLILTEDKIPGRWVRNLDALTVKQAGSM